MKPKIFVDTSYFKALLDIKDDFYKRATQLSYDLEKRQVKLITTNFILDESYTLLRKRRGLSFAKNLRELVFSQNKDIQIFRVQAQDEANAWTLFVENWSDLSFTDCTSFAIMNRLELTDVATFDSHFARAGFTIFK